jgi:hypothetical protein
MSDQRDEHEPEGAPSMNRKITIAIPELDVTSTVRLLTELAPRTCDAIWNVLEEPVERRLIHTTVTGSVVFFYDFPPLEGAPELPLENHTIYPKAGEILYFYQPWNGLKGLADHDPSWRRPQDDVHEMFFAYGDANLRMPMEEGWRGSVWGVIEEGLDDFAKACRWMRMEGTKRITLSRQNS